MQDLIDGRTIRGMKRAHARLDETALPDAIPLRNYLNKIDVAECLYKNNLANYTDDELHKMIAVVESEGAQLPCKIQARLVERYAQQKLDSKQWEELVEAIFPFEAKPWSSTLPSVSGVHADPASKYATWEVICMRQILAPLLHKGPEGRDAVHSLSKIVVARVEEVDAVELCLLGAAALSNAECVFTCLLALAEEQLDTQKEASPKQT